MVVLLLVSGAIINVAVAWGLYLWRPFQGYPFRPTTASESQQVWDRAWPTGTRFHDDPTRRQYTPDGQVVATPAYRIIFIGHGPFQRGGTEWRDGSAWELRAGWPARSLIGHRWASETANHGLLIIKDSWIPSRKTGSPILDDYLPYRPSWSGFAINTLVYATFLWLIFIGPFALRRKLRKTYGHCAACGYNMHGSKPGNKICPECGAATT